MDYKPNTIRDTVAVCVANLVLKISSKHYQAMLRGAILYGMASAKRDNFEGREAPGTEWL